MLRVSRKAGNVHEMSFVSGMDLTESQAKNRAKVGLLYATKNDNAMVAEIIRCERFGPFKTIQDAAKEKEISLI